MTLSFLRRRPNAREQAVADRLPPGQYLTEKWPVLHYAGVPRVDLTSWDFRIDGLVEQPLRLTYDELQQLPRTEIQADIHCVTRWSLLDSTWGGIALTEVLKLVRIKPQATHVVVRAEHGWPLRLFVPHLYFWKSAKWVRGFEFLDRDRPGFWESFGYHNHGDPWKEERYG